MKINLTTNIAGIKLENPLYNASGVYCREISELNQMIESPSGAVITKSCTLEKRTGNPKPRYSTAAFGSINSMGLPNNGVNFYRDFIIENRGKGKPIFLSVSGMSVEENLKILERISQHMDEAVIELNLSCPNVVGKPQVGYEFDDMEKMLEKVSEAIDPQKILGVKLPPYFDIAHFERAAMVLNKFNNIQFVTCINSIGNGLLIDVEKEEVLIKPKSGFGGIGGKYVLPTALANVRQFYKLLPQKQIIGCGGVYSGKEAFSHILCGASAVQVGTFLYENGTSVFAQIIDELKALMVQKNYSCLEDFRGKLTPLNRADT